MKHVVLIGVLSIAALASAACFPVYLPPPQGAPHASVELSITYHIHPDASVAQSVQIDGLPFDMPAPERANDPRAERPFSRWVRVPVHRTHFRVTSELATMDLGARVYGPTVIRDEGRCRGGGCGEPRVANRDQWSSEPSVDAACTAELDLDTRAGRSYFVEFDFYGDGHCTLRLVRADG